ncbi:MAG: aminopeptidase N, partial [Bdellovibrionales bacterium]|nr:aminopeptidase N [Bdellovibrionales bacterium]
DKTQVKAHYKIERNKNQPPGPLVFNGEELKFISLKYNGTIVSDYELGPEHLVFQPKEDEFEVEVENYINPTTNKALEGLYKSGDIYCTQNEPEGFRRITYFVDRPDNMTVFTTKIIGDKKEQPILLSNGNLIESGDLDNNRHFAVWNDPFPKPSYLFALVAGDLGLIQDSYITGSNKEIDLRIYCDKGNEDKCHWAMESLKNSMKWDEERYGLEYDLDIYMIVAVDAFNMGAMENKGLNIFNTSCVLADPKMATDDNFMTIESVIGHEYFHNWTGNRITCRDWFQLTLKEGLTVYRDQEFSADLNDRAVQRIKDVYRLRESQFPEDAGPTSHPIKPERYIEINNFYTATVYEKGSEVIRMIETLLGREGFRKGMDKYFELYDGQAVRTEDFLHAMSLANGNFDFTQFKRWYSQAGTPKLKIRTSYDKKQKQFCLSVEQILSNKNEQYFIPLKIALLSKSGEELNISHEKIINEDVLIISNMKEDFIFNNVEELPVVSLNRDFSAPVIIDSDLSFEDYLHLLRYDNNLFNKYESAQNIYKKIFFDRFSGKGTEEFPTKLIESLKDVLLDSKINESFKALLLSLPSFDSYFASQNPINVEKTVTIAKLMKKQLSMAIKDVLFELYESLNTEKEFIVNATAMGKRSLKNTVLNFLMETEQSDVVQLCKNQYHNALNMTDEISSLSLLVNHEIDGFEQDLNSFYKKWHQETLVMQKWMRVQVASETERGYNIIPSIEKNDVFDITIPNIARALYGAFAANVVQFHHSTGRGYKLLADKIIELNKINPQVAARLSGAYKSYAKLDSQMKKLMEKELIRIKSTPQLSKNVFEIISKVLDQK